MNELKTVSDGMFKKPLLVFAAAALGLSAIGLFTNPARFFPSYLIGFLYCMNIPLGCLLFLLIHNLTGGKWGDLSRKYLLSGVGTFTLMAVLFLPLIAGKSHLYSWTIAEHVMKSEVLAHKKLYLNVPFFIGRAVLYFFVWISLSRFLTRAESKRTADSQAPDNVRLRHFSGPALVAYGLTASFAAFDWAMSIEPEWFSTIYGLHFVAGQGLATLALVICLLLWNNKPDEKTVTARHDLGNLMLAFVMLWAYVSFSQYLIIWSGNLAEEIPWIVRRTSHGWQWVGLTLALFHFAVPFLMLLSRDVKRGTTVRWVALGILFFRLVDLLWLVVPAYSEHFSLHWLDVTLPAGLIALWLAFYLKDLERRKANV